MYAWLTGRPTPGKQAELLYNRDASELRHKKELVLHLGCNNWAGQKKEVCMHADLMRWSAYFAVCSIRGCLP